MNEYSDDRKSLAQEIMLLLKNKGYWVPKDYVGPDIILAIGLALEEKEKNNVV